MTLVLLLGMTIACAVTLFVRVQIKIRRYSSTTWEELLARLQPVPSHDLTTVALDYLHPRKGQIAIGTDQLWQMVGGTEGLRRMSANAEVLIALAGYAQRWNSEEGGVVAERMRHDGLALRRATNKLSLGLLLGSARASGPFYVQEAASAYYLMRQRLLALYETSHAGRYPQLSAALS